MSDLDDLRDAVDRLTNQFARVEPGLAAVRRRLTIVIVSAVVLGAIAFFAVVLIAFQVRASQTAIDDSIGTMCPVIRILASTDPPRTTPAGRDQVRRILAETQRPDYPCR